jgi:repressor LexA
MPRRPIVNLRRSPAAPLVPLAPRVTARQQQILDWIRSFIESRGMPPTRAEIAAGLGFSSASSAEDHLQALAKKGALELVPGASRGLRLKDIPGVPVQGTLPLVGRVAAGQPILAAENVEARYRVDAALFSPRADYLLRVRGMSMKDAGILDGDLLVVHRAADARSGQIVVARLSGASGDEVTVKRLRRRGREIVLHPENSEFEPIVVNPAHTDLAIEGVAVGLLRTGALK